MNRTIWKILGILCILAGLSMLWQTPERLTTLPPDQHLKLIEGLIFSESLLGAIVIMCFFPKSYPVTLRIVGAYGVTSCIFVLVEGVRHHDFSQFPTLLVFWLPGSIYLVIKGKMTFP